MTGRHRQASQPSHTGRLAGFMAVGAILAAGHTVPQPEAVAAQPVPVVLTQPKPTVVLTQPPLRPERILKVTGRQGLTGNAVALLDYIDRTYPEVKVVGGVRQDPIPDHPSGRALDIMVGANQQLGQRICDDLLAQAGTLHIRYLIWKETYHRPGVARWMADRGSATANHFDHVHVTVN